MQISEFPADCERHGAYTARRMGDYTTRCPACAEEQRAAEEQRRRMRDQQVSRRHWLVRALSEAGIPAKFAAARMAQLEAPFAHRVRVWVDAATAGKSSGPLVLAGSVGVGKSHAAAAAMRAWIVRARQAARYTTASDYSAVVRDCWRRDADQSESRVEQRHAEVALLVLDDLGAGRAIDSEILQGLISARYAAGRLATTIISTNIAPAGFDAAFGERVADRLREGATLITCAGKSRRRPAC
ncbi:MAG: ATP-binding protein [Sinimarinibacterium flocculans]|uniref:ATP-binding protein n=1 Tax=Sinimarinibacterium flocculans TaxID=985250 RepID=UPI003C53787D